MARLGINIVIEREKRDSEIIFIVSSPDVNVFAEGKDIDKVKDRFIKGVRHHLETFPEERELLIKKENSDMPMVQRIFL